MKEHPILFNDAMVLAILDGTKTQTRRPMKPQPPNPHGSSPECHWLDCGAEPEKQRFGICGPLGENVAPYGGPGDRLWVRECWGRTSAETLAPFEIYDILTGSADTLRRDVALAAHYRATEKFPDVVWRPSIHMPRWVSRITLEVTGVRAERVQDISGDDVWAEGIDNGKSNRAMGVRFHNMQRMAFRDIWDSIYAKKGLGWAENPWVWATTFRMIRP